MDDTDPIEDLRDRVITAVDDDISSNDAAERFGVAVSTAVPRPWLKDK